MSDLTSTKTQSKEEILARSVLYRALSVLFRHPSDISDFISFKDEFPIWRKAVATLSYPEKNLIAGALDAIIQEFDKITKQKWIDEYESCFGHTAHGVVPAYELEYGEEHSHRQPQQLGDIAAFYTAFGLKMNDSVHERVDHIAIECEFMFYLIVKEVFACGHNDEDKAALCREASLKFLSEHLGSWLPSFCAKLSKVKTSGLLKSIADFSSYFVFQDCKALGIEPGPDSLPIRIVQEKIEAGCVSCSTNNQG